MRVWSASSNKLVEDIRVRKVTWGQVFKNHSFYSMIFWSKGRWKCLTMTASKLTGQYERWTAARSTLAFPVWDPGGFTGRFRAPRKHIPVHRSLLNHHHDPTPLNVTYLKAERRKWSLRKHIPLFFDRLESSKIQSFNQTSTKTRGLVPENLCGFIKWNYFRCLLPYDDSKTQCQDEFRNLSGCVLKILTASRMLQISIARCQIEPEIHSFPTMYGKGGYYGW